MDQPFWSSFPHLSSTYHSIHTMLPYFDCKLIHNISVTLYNFKVTKKNTIDDENQNEKHAKNNK